MSFIHVPFCSRYYFMDEKRCISVPRTRSQIGAINTQQVDTDGEYFYSLLRENECFAEMCRKCFISPQLWWGHVARGTCQCLHIPPITAESVAADTGKYYSWRDYLESVLSILRWTLATTLCGAPDSELWLPSNTHRIQHKKYFNIKKYLLANVVAGEMTERDWGCEGPARGAPELPAPPPPIPASNPGITARPLPSRHCWAMNCVPQVLLHQCVFFMHILGHIVF